MARLGVDFGERLAQAAKDNEKGFWEHVEIVALHDKLLASLGSSWDDEAPLPQDWTERDRSREIQAALTAIVARDFAGKKLFGFKDPRVSRLLPLWFPIFEQLEIEPHFVLMVRHPWEVAESLLRRNGIVPSKSMLLWMRYTLEAESATRRNRRTVVSYDELLGDPGALLARLWQDLDLPPQGSASAEGAVGEFLQGSLRHHRADEGERKSAGVIPPVVLQAYEAVLEGVGSAAAVKKIGQLTEQFELFSTLFHPRMEYLSTAPADVAETEAWARYLQLEQEFEEKVRHVAMLQGELEERRGQVAATQKAFEEKAEHVAILQQQLIEREQQLREREQQVMEARQAFDEKVTHVGILRREIEEKSRQVDERSRQVEEKSAESAEKSRQIAEARAAFDEKVRHVAILQQELEEKARQVAHFKDEAERQLRAVDLVTARLQLADDRLERVSNELLDARWEALTMRSNALHATDPVEDTAPKILELETRAQVAESERDNLREMLKELQTDLEAQQAAREGKETELKATKKELRFQQKQMARLRAIVSRKLILPFGRSQRKIQQLTAAAQGE